MNIKDTGTLAKKFVTRATAAQGDYKDGVTGSGAKFEAAAKGANDAYEQGVTAAISRKAYSRGLDGSGSKYEKNATTLGPARFAQGVQNAGDAWQQGVQPSLDRLKSLTLPPRGPKRSPQNMARAAAVATALGALKEGK
ncbi:MAG TPA: hypothetical protein VJN96_09130 [Vicinamibacterales bacterium]|nr:hypothetical protein [Vicinamibacterales bacterium]